MKIQLKKDYRGEFEEVTVEKGSTIEQLYKSLEAELPYTVLAAKVNNKLVTLAYKFYRDCKVELLDMRTQVANLIYPEQSEPYLPQGGIRCFGRMRS